MDTLRARNDQIRTAVAEEGLTCREAGSRFGISGPMVHKIVKNG